MPWGLFIDATIRTAIYGSIRAVSKAHSYKYEAGSKKFDASVFFSNLCLKWKNTNSKLHFPGPFECVLYPPMSLNQRFFLLHREFL